MKRRGEDDVILQFISCTFLHLQSTVSTEPNGKPKKAFSVNEKIEKDD